VGEERKDPPPINWRAKYFCFSICRVESRICLRSDELVEEREVWMNFTEHTKIRKEKFGTVVFDTLTEKIFITDQIGGEILELIDDGKDLPEILNALGDSYEGGREMMEKDVTEFTDQLKSNNIICEGA